MAGEEELTVGGGVPIRPPRLEDAGLEDCALPPESIAEAFSLAAAAVSSRLARLPFSEDSDEEDCVSAPRGGGCVDDAGLDCGAAPVALVGGGVAGVGSVDEVVVVGGGRGGGYEDAVVVGGRAEEEDTVVVIGEQPRDREKKLGKDDGCVEGVREGVSEPRRAQGDEDGEEAAEKAILVPDFD